MVEKLCAPAAAGMLNTVVATTCPDATWFAANGSCYRVTSALNADAGCACEGYASRGT
jgi:hypothetical protein